MKRLSFKLGTTSWYCLSVFYARNKWIDLINSVIEFYTIRKQIFSNCLIYLCEERGENIRISFSSSYIDENYIYNQINNFIRDYLKDNPSFDEKKFLYGEGIWCYYHNNSIEWNRFHFNYDFILYSQKTSFLLMQMIQNDISIDNCFSIALFLSMKILKNIKSKEIIMNKLDYAIKFQIDKYENMDLIYSAQKNISQYISELNNITEAISNYWNENDGIELSDIYIDWKKEFCLILLLNRIDDLLELISIICDHLGLGKLYIILILKSIKSWIEHENDCL